MILCFVGKNVASKNAILGDAKQVSCQWELSCVRKPSACFKFISENITAISQLTSLRRGDHDDFRHTRG